MKKAVENAGRDIRTVRRMIQNILLEFFPKRSGDVRGTGPRLVLEQAHVRDKNNLLLFSMYRRTRVKVSQYAAALIFEPGGIKSTRRMSFLSQNTDAMFFFTEI